MPQFSQSPYTILGGNCCDIITVIVTIHLDYIHLQQFTDMIVIFVDFIKEYKDS